MNWWKNLPTTPERSAWKNRCIQELSPEENSMFDRCMREAVRDNYCREHWRCSLDIFEQLENKYNALKNAYEKLLSERD